MLQIGDRVVYAKDGAKGIVIGAEGSRYHVMWEDEFVSWEEGEWLRVETIEQTEKAEQRE